MMAGPSGAVLRCSRSPSTWARGRVVALLVLILAVSFVQPPPTHAGTAMRCWTASVAFERVLRCRVGSEEAVDFEERALVGIPLHAGVGEDLWGRCWFDADTWSGWVASGHWADESATLLRIVGQPGGDMLMNIGAVRRCTTDPVMSLEGRSVQLALRAYHYELPEPTFQPQAGVVGLPTYLEVLVAEIDRFVIGNPERRESLFVEVDVSAVVVDWGDDGGVAVYSEDRHADLTGYPHGDARHTYARSGSYDFDIGFQWRARWRVGWNQVWHEIDLGVFTERRPYTVDEIVVRVIR